MGAAAALLALTLLPTGAATARPAETSPAPEAELTEAELTEPAAVDQLAWEPCDDAPDFDCATYPVPVDYDAPDGPTYDIAVTRLRAVDPESSLGTVVLYPGGPTSGVDWLKAVGRGVDAETGGRFDVVSFDPRGIGASSPEARCVDRTLEAFAAFSPGVTEPGNNAEAQTLGAAYTVFNGLCGERNPELLPTMSSENFARDLDELRALLGEDTLRFLGYSYGTYLGATYANLFPDRVGPMVLDGVVNPETWSADSGTWAVDTVVDADDALEGFYESCEEAGPEACALADRGAKRTTEGLLRQLERRGALQAPDAVSPGIVTETDVVGLLFSYMYAPFFWPLLAEAIDQAADGDATLLRDLIAGPVGEDVWDPGYEQQFATPCADGGDEGQIRDWRKVAREGERNSRTFGEWYGLGYWYPCVTWPVDASDSYDGPWDASTATPVLIIGETADPVTPLASAERLAELMPGSRLLVHNGFGHTSGAQPSTCTSTAIQEYLVDGTLPPEGTVCEPDAPPFAVAPAAALAEDASDGTLSEVSTEVVEEQLPERNSLTGVPALVAPDSR